MAEAAEKVQEKVRAPRRQRTRSKSTTPPVEATQPVEPTSEDEDPFAVLDKHLPEGAPSKGSANPASVEGFTRSTQDAPQPIKPKRSRKGAGEAKKAPESKKAPAKAPEKAPAKPTAAKAPKVQEPKKYRDGLALWRAQQKVNSAGNDLDTARGWAAASVTDEAMLKEAMALFTTAQTAMADLNAMFKEVLPERKA